MATGTGPSSAEQRMRNAERYAQMIRDRWRDRQDEIDTVAQQVGGPTKLMETLVEWAFTSPDNADQMFEADEMFERVSLLFERILNGLSIDIPTLEAEWRALAAGRDAASD